ncbi:hypothetical protein ED733_002773 [Metarhizium rileyi]|uniref:Uncharacterized protein n=1 Tax=Metarhizium rileyi (strain RCEF 4871) TaxID=1649241 RepID=A0A5C6GBJ7_METRR|nr:hypothetical protein ED733_002773 [Metarhizium rileyi]
MLPCPTTAAGLQFEQGVSDASIYDLDASCFGLVDYCCLSGYGMGTQSSTTGLVGTNSALAAPTTRELHIEAVIAERLRFALDEIKKVPSLMISETQTPWCHPLLYKDGMPRSMQDAHASCALYLAKTPLNASIIFRAIDIRVNDLLSSPPPTTLLEILAHAQSLILYQAIRLFDGDIHARAAAERIMPEVEDSAMCLLAHVRFDLGSPAGELPLYPVAPTRDFWNDWILQESARRTVLFCFFFLQAYRLVAGQKGLECDGRLGLCRSWTMSAHLWNAGTPVQFARAWRDKKHFVVTDAHFEEVLRDARADDVDRFGRMWISSLLGMEEAEGWFASKGGVLSSSSSH